MAFFKSLLGPSLKFVAYLFLLLGIGLMSLNIYGSFKDLRPINMTPDVLRFGEEDVKITPEQFKSGVVRQENESDRDYATRVTLVIADGLAHVEWLDYQPDLFHQRIPIWENYILHIIGRVSGIPEFERYHFSNPHRGIERGIGLCGDASMILSGLLDEQGIPNTIVTVPGHVMVQAVFGDESILLDADFGVVLSKSVEFYKDNHFQLAAEYQNQLGRINDGELMISNNLKEHGFTHWQGTSHFITKKYYFEKVAYVGKWVIPLFCLVLGAALYYRQSKPNS